MLPVNIYQKIKKDTLKIVRGTVQADILKEDQAQNTCIFSTEFALKMMGDVQEYFIEKQVRNFYSVSISGYHIAEAGANPITQLAFTLANGFTYVEYYLSRGMDINKFAKLKAAAKIPREPSVVIGKNQQLWDLGTTHLEMEEAGTVQAKISRLDSEFDLVLIAEYYDESLVLLADILCWDLFDVRYLKLNARKASKVSNITEAARGSLETWLEADRKLYDHFAQKINRLIDRSDLLKWA